MSTATVINLIPRRLRDRAAVRQRIRRWVAACAFFAVTLGAACVALRLVGGEESSRLASDGGRLAERLANAQQSLERLRAQLQDINRRKEAAEMVGVHPDWSVLLGALTELRGQDIVIQSIDLKAVEPEPQARTAKKGEGKEGEKPKGKPKIREAYAVDIRGYGLSQVDVLKFINRLEEAGPLVDVRVKETRAQPYMGVAAVAFNAQFRLVEGPARVEAAAGGAKSGSEDRP